MNAKINISFDHRSLLSVPVTRVIRQCVLGHLQAEKVPVPCEINVLLTNDDGIHAINLASRRWTAYRCSLLSHVPADTGAPAPGLSDYLDPETACVPWAIWPFLWSGPERRRWNSATRSAGRWGISPSTPCSTCWAMITWTRGRKRPRCGLTRRPSSAPLIYIDKINRREKTTWIPK